MQAHTDCFCCCWPHTDFLFFWSYTDCFSYTFCSSCSVSEPADGDELELAHGSALVLDGDVSDPVHGGVLVRGVAGAGLLLVVVARACPSRDILLPSSWSRWWRRSLRTSPFSARASSVRRRRVGCPTTDSGTRAAQDSGVVSSWDSLRVRAVTPGDDSRRDLAPGTDTG